MLRLRSLSKKSSIASVDCVIASAVISSVPWESEGQPGLMTSTPTLGVVGGSTGGEGAQGAEATGTALADTAARLAGKASCCWERWRCPRSTLCHQRWFCSRVATAGQRIDRRPAKGLWQRGSGRREQLPPQLRHETWALRSYSVASASAAIRAAMASSRPSRTLRSAAALASASRWASS